jgi:nucleoside phosphorylase
MNAVIGLVAATQWEMKPWLSISRSKPTGHLPGGGEVFGGNLGETVVVTAIGGIGIDGAREATQCLLKAHKPDAIFSVGFSGALTPELKAGDFVIEGRDRGLDLVALGAGKETGWVHIGQIASAREALETPQKKKDFYAQTRANAVDMEWEGVKTAAREAGVLCAAVKIISDSAGEEIPLPKGLRRHTGHLSMKRVIQETLRDPFSLPKTIWFGNRSAKLSKSLATFLKEFVISTAPIVAKSENHSQGSDRVQTCQ